MPTNIGLPPHRKQSGGVTNGQKTSRLYISGWRNRFLLYCQNMISSTASVGCWANTHQLSIVLHLSGQGLTNIDEMTSFFVVCRRTLLKDFQDIGAVANDGRVMFKTIFFLWNRMDLRKMEMWWPNLKRSHQC